MEIRGKADYLIQESGCGLFQVLIVFIVYGITKLPLAYTMMFMSFGNYNPGWRCLDNDTMTTANSSLQLNDSVAERAFESSTTNQSTVGYEKGSCELFESCKNVEFDPETSNIVTEWGLLCDKKWATTVIISVQMAGVLIGSLIAGQMGDTFGRKKTLFGAMALTGVLNVVCVFSTSWQVFTVLKFFTGLMLACLLPLCFILPAEFLTRKWRGRLAPLPTWHICGVFFALTCMACKDWKIMHLISAGLSLFSFLFVLWVPESMRWLEVKNKTEQFIRVAKKVADMNKIDLFKHKSEELTLNSDKNMSADIAKETDVKYTLLDLFRKGYRVSSFIVGLYFFSNSIIYYAISFGVKTMGGNFYINLIIVFAIEIPFSPLPIMLPNIAGRRLSSVVFLLLSAFCLYISMCLDLWASDNARDMGILVLALTAKTSIDGAWYTATTHTSEIYPTVVRSNALAYGSMMARVGGVVAPFFIPQDPDTVYICYAVMGSLGLVCGVLQVMLPETKGMKLKETFGEDKQCNGVQESRENIFKTKL